MISVALLWPVNVPWLTILKCFIGFTDLVKKNLPLINFKYHNELGQV
jgi:hypothetical protein